jgi:hypothetical protein
VLGVTERGDERGPLIYHAGRYRRLASE